MNKKSAVENVKHVLFGLQKQGNVINEALCDDITNFICEQLGGEACSSEDSVIDSIKQLGQDVIDGTHELPDWFIKYVMGTQSFNNLKTSHSPLVMSAERSNPESPKMNFRILVLGELPEESAESTLRTATGGFTVTGPEVSHQDMGATLKTELPNSKSEHMETARERVDRLVRTLSRLCPIEAAKELDSDIERALYVSEFYFKNN